MTLADVGELSRKLQEIEVGQPKDPNPNPNPNLNPDPNQVSTSGGAAAAAASAAADEAAKVFGEETRDSEPDATASNSPPTNLP